MTIFASCAGRSAMIVDIPSGSSKHETRRISRALVTESSNSSGVLDAIAFRTRLPT